MRNKHHTPLPWRLGNFDESAPNTIDIVGADGNLVCTVKSFPCRMTGKADAELIIMGANNYVRLLKACADVITELTPHPKADETLKAFKALISAATGSEVSHE